MAVEWDASIRTTTVTKSYEQEVSDPEVPDARAVRSKSCQMQELSDASIVDIRFDHDKAESGDGINGRYLAGIV